MKWAFVVLTLLAAPAAAQEFAEAPAGVLRWLDKLTGKTGDMELARGQSATNGRLTVQLDACRYPADNPAGEAQAHLTIMDSTRDGAVFTGWMLSASPALSAMDHPRYDVWVLACVVPGYTPPEAEITEEAEGE
jgi:hypothetical protein